MRISLLNDGIYDYQPDVITEPIRNIIDSTSNIKLTDETTVFNPQPTYLEPILTGGIKPQVTSLEPTLIGGAIATVATTPISNEIVYSDNTIKPISQEGVSNVIEPNLGLPINTVKIPDSNVGAFMGSLENGELGEPTSVTDVLKKEAKFPYWLIAVVLVGGYLVLKKK
jgi:hypothetical protein